MNNITIKAVLKSELDARNVRCLLERLNVGNAEIQVSDLRDAGALQGAPPDILLVDLGRLEPGDFEALAKLARETARQTAILVTAEQASVSDIRQLMRFGVVDFVPRPFSVDDLMSAIDAAAERLEPPEAQSTGQVVTFLGAGGGVGATTVMVQAGAQLLQRTGMGGVCLVDLDLQFGNAALSLDLPSDPGLLTILESPSRLDAAFLRGATSVHSSGLAVLAAPPSVVPLDAMSPELITSVLELARQEFKATLVDLPPVWTAWTASVIGLSDLVVLVGEMNVPALDRCKRQLEVLGRLDETPIIIAMNRFEAGWGWRTRSKQAETVLGRPIDVFVRNDAETAGAARDRGVLLREIKQRSRIERDVARLVAIAEDRLAGQPPARVAMTV